MSHRPPDRSPGRSPDRPPRDRPDRSHRRGAPTSALVLGGASDIGLATVARLARDGLGHATLATRDPAALEERLASAALPVERVDVVAWDALVAESHREVIRRARSEMGRLDVVICAVGLLGHHAGLDLDPVDADLLLRSNLSGPASAALAAVQELVDQGSGDLVVISSVAGARARRSNFVYGAAKAGIDAFGQGLADAVAGTEVRVHVVRPGFVRSKMTAGLPPAPLSTTPPVVADAIVAALSSDRSQIAWVPRTLGPIMAIMRLLPRPVWRLVSGDR